MQSGNAQSATKGAELGEEAFHFSGIRVPGLKLANAGRVPDPAAELEAEQLSGCRRMPTFLR